VADGPPATVVNARIGLLLRMRARTLGNRVRQAALDAPIRLATAAGMILLIWMALYGMFHLVFHMIRRTPLEATVAFPMVFSFFFAAMLVLLTFSNAILAYGLLFSRREAAYLLTLPVPPLDVITLKFLECVVLSSWSMVLLGLPLMTAMANLADHPVFHVLFVAFFLAFIPIPGALGLILAWAVAKYFPRRAMKAATILAAAALFFALMYGVRSMRMGDSATEVWLRAFLSRMGFVEAAFLPNHWVAAGIDHALHSQFGDACLYLGVTLANAFFLSWIAVRIVSAKFGGAYDHAGAFRNR